MKKNHQLMFKFMVWLQILMQGLLPSITMAAPRYEAAEASVPFVHSDILANTAQQLSSNKDHVLQSTAANVASGVAASSAEHWLGQYGTAKLTLNVDEYGRWHNSSLDFLYPLQSDENTVLFTQVGLRTPDERVTGNIGLGLRTYRFDNWMLGGNFFTDHDFTGHNRRVSVGAEAWRDNLKLSANAYLGTTSWHQSRDFEDYNEKPADGFDMRVEGYLPSWPQLGAKLVYEKYYGRNVALFNKNEDDLQKDPSAITTGLIYTPVPMITSSIDYRRGQSSMDEFNFAINFRYVLGQSLAAQLSPDQVATKRTLAGSRYDLVERNNEIILQYKKKVADTVVTDLILTTVTDNSPADGVTNNEISLHALTANGLPASNAAITWAVSGNGVLSSQTAITDQNGNTRVNITNTRAEQVSVSATAGSLSRSLPSTFGNFAAQLELTLTKDNSLADGIEQNEGIVLVKDQAGNPMPAVAVSWQVNNGATIVSSDSTTDNQGQARVSFANTSPGQVTLTASANNLSQQVNANFTIVAVANLAVSMTTDNAPADGVNANVAQAVVTSASGAPMAGVNVSWTLTGSAANTSPLSATTDASGIATLNLTDITPETVTVSASAGGQSGQTIATFAIVAVANLAVTMTTDNALADGVDANVAQAVVTSANGNPIQGVTVSWTLTGSAANTSPLSATTDANGIATLNLTDITPETVTVSASAGGQNGQTTATFAIVVANLANSISFTTSGRGSLLDPGIVTATIRNTNGDPVAGLSVNWVNPSNNNLVCGAGAPVTDSQGQVAISCYAQNANVTNYPITVSVGAADSVDPNNPVSGTYTRHYLL